MIFVADIVRVGWPEEASVIGQIEGAVPLDGRRLFLAQFAIFRVDGEGGDDFTVFGYLGDLTGAFFFDLINAYHRVHGDIGPRDTLELRLQVLFRGINHHGCLVAENQLFDFDEAEQVSLPRISCVDLVDLALVVKDDPVDWLLGHSLCSVTDNLRA